MRDVVDHGCIFIELRFHLVEVGDRKIGTLFNAAAVRFELPQQDVQQRSLARTIGSDDANAVAAQNGCRQVLDQRVALVTEACAGRLHHQLAGAFRLGDFHRGRAGQFTTLAALLAHFL